MTGEGGLIEVQATAERTPLSRAHLDELLALAGGGIEHLRTVQEAAIAAGARRSASARRSPMRFVLATNNPHKRREFAALLAPHEVVALDERVDAAPRDGDDLRRERAREGARRGGGHVDGGDRRRLGHRGGGARRRARRLLGALRRPGRHRRGEPGEAAARGAGRERARVRMRDRARGPVRWLRAPVRGALHRAPGRAPAGDRGVRLRPRLHPRRRTARSHDGRALAGREGRDQPPGPRGARAARGARGRARRAAAGRRRRRRRGRATSSRASARRTRRG